MKSYPLLPWNPDADVKPAKQATLLVGTAGGSAYVGVCGWGDGHEVSGGRLTLAQLEVLIVRLADLRDELRDHWQAG